MGFFSPVSLKTSNFPTMMTRQFTLAAILIGAVACTGATAQTASGGQDPAPNELIYVPAIPTAAELSQTAVAQGQTIASIRQVNGEEIVTYRLSDNRVNIVAYLPLSAAGSAAPAASGAATLVPTPSTAAPAVGPAVVYESPSPDYSYDYPDYYPWGWYSGPYFGFGYGYGYGRGYGYGGRGFGYRGGGFHGGGGGGHGGGGHR